MDLASGSGLITVICNKLDDYADNYLYLENDNFIYYSNYTV